MSLTLLIKYFTFVNIHLLIKLILFQVSWTYKDYSSNYYEYENFKLK